MGAQEPLDSGQEGKVPSGDVRALGALYDQYAAGLYAYLRALGAAGVARGIRWPTGTAP